jgi:hypothetical protein
LSLNGLACIVENALELERLALPGSIWHTMATRRRTPDKGEVDGSNPSGPTTRLRKSERLLRLPDSTDEASKGRWVKSKLKAVFLENRLLPSSQAGTNRRNLRAWYDSTRRTACPASPSHASTPSRSTAEPAALARFYGELLEWPVPAGHGDYVALHPPGGGTAITFQRAAGFVAPTWPDPAVQQQLDLDLAVDDLDPPTSGRSL